MPLFCPGAEFSNDIDHHNSATSKPSSRQSRMGNGQKAGNSSIFAFYLLLFTFI
jgi:hypothetical protein